MGTLYIVATPIGNLDDMTPRAIAVLKSVDLVAAEDTRHSRRLMDHFGINTPMLSLHEHNEKNRSSALLARLGEGLSIALVSDAGTPLISDPGYHLVSDAREQGYTIRAVPGACALVVALSAAGLPTDRFCFEGFLPAKPGNRRRALEALADESRTLVFYESPHRILDSLQDMGAVLGTSRRCVIGRELTKQFETWYEGSLDEVLEELRSHEDHRRGEFVVMVGGNPVQRPESTVNVEQLLKLLIPELPLKKAAAICASVTGLSRNELYALGLTLRDDPAAGRED